MAYPADIEQEEKVAEETLSWSDKERRRLGEIPSPPVPFLEGYIRKGDPRVTVDPPSLERTSGLNRQLVGAASRIALRMKQTKKGSNEWNILEKMYRDTEKASNDMFRLARELGKRPSGSGATPRGRQAATQVVERYEKSGEVPPEDEILQMKREIEVSLLAGNETQRGDLETKIGKKGLKRLASLRTKAIEADARANAAALEKTGQPLTDEARANPRASGLPSYVVIAMETARQKTEKFNAELAQAATLSFQRLAAGHRKLKGRRGKVTTLTPRVPPEGEQLTSVEQLIQQPGERRARLPGRGVGRGVGRRKPSGNERVMFDWLAKKHPYIFRDIRGSTKRAGAVRFNIAMDRVDWTPAQLKKWYEGEQKGATPEQAADARMIHRTLFKQYDRTIEVSQGLQKGHYVRHTQKMELAHQAWLYKLDQMARAQTDAEAKNWTAFERAMYLERYKLGLAKPGKFVTKQVPDILGDIIELESTTISIAAPPPGEMPKRYQVSQEDVLDPKRGAARDPAQGPGSRKKGREQSPGGEPGALASKLRKTFLKVKQVSDIYNVPSNETREAYTTRTMPMMTRLKGLDPGLFKEVHAEWQEFRLVQLEKEGGK